MTTTPTPSPTGDSLLREAVAGLSAMYRGENPERRFASHDVAKLLDAILAAHPAPTASDTWREAVLEAAKITHMGPPRGTPSEILKSIVAWHAQIPVPPQAQDTVGSDDDLWAMEVAFMSCSGDLLACLEAAMVALRKRWKTAERGEA